ncbi:MAG: lytic transglycosylase [Paucimonas sp.]|nr:lytic transglycosylase [Paucimonas sp.]
MSLALPPDLPPACLFQAAADYQVPPAVLYAIRKVEGGTLGKSNPNTNGTRDYGPMQINTVWIKRFQQNENLTAEVVASQPCIAIRSAAYVLRFELNRTGADFWRGVGNYHSKTPERNQAYRQKVYQHALRYDQHLRSIGWID